MKKPTRLVAMLLCVVIILGAGLGYAVLTAQRTVSNILSIEGLDIEIYSFVLDDTDYSGETALTGIDWNTMETDTTSVYDVVLVNNGNVAINYDFTDDLDSAIGAIVWELEVYQASSWVWHEYSAGRAIVNRGIIPDEVLGIRPASPTESVAGRLRISLTVEPDATLGATSGFDITVTGTES